MVRMLGRDIQTKEPSKKLNHRFYRPYAVIEQIGTQAYLLKLSQLVGSLKNVFHVLLLKPYVSGGHSAHKLPPPIEDYGKENYKLERILKSAYHYNTFYY